MTEPQSFTLDLENKGLLISRPGDVLASGYFPSMLNMTADKTGYIGSRGGTSRVSGSTDLGGAVHSQGCIIVQGTPYVYQGAGTSLYRAWSQIATGFSGNPLTMRDGGPDLSVLPFEIIWDSLQRFKDDGVTTSNFGIAGPMAMASAAAAATLTKTIDLFEYATNVAIQAAWPATNGTVTTNTTNPYQGSYCGNIAIASLATGYITRTAAFDLSKFTVTGDSTDSDYIVIAIRVDNVANVAQILLEFDVDPATNDFAHNFYAAAFAPNPITPAVTGSQTASQTINNAIIQQAIASGVLVFGDTASQIPNLVPRDLPLGTNQWLQIFVRKNAFVRVGSSLNNWANVAAIRISVQTNALGSVNVGVDDLIMQSGDNLNAANYEWLYRYRNDLTGTVSPFSPVMTSQVTITATNATVTVRNPRDTQATHIELYRKGGDNSIFSFAADKVVASWTGTTTITDSIPDADLGDTADLTQVELANLAQTPSQTCTSAQLTANSGGTYTDDTSNVSDDNPATYANLSGMTNVAGGGWLLIGADQLFRQILIVLDAHVNVNASTLTVQYWNGTAWYGILNPVDGTAAGGKTFARGGTIEFDLPTDWAISSANSIAAYYVRLSVSATLSAAVHVTEVRVGANAFDPVTMEIFNGRLWSNDTRHTDRVWYSERFTPEIFLTNNYVTRSRSGDPIVRPFGLDDQLFVLSDFTVDRLIGSDAGSFQLIPTGAEVGLFSSNAICKGRGRIFYRSYGGIYELPGSGFSNKITIPIELLFKGAASADGAMQPIDNTKASTEAMEFYGAKVHFAYTDINGLRQEILYDLDLERWEPWDRPSTSYLRRDDVAQFWRGETDGYVYRSGVGNTDQGTPINIRFATPYIDFGAASVSKQITEIAIDCDLQGASIAFFAGFDNGVGALQTANLSNSGGRGTVYLPLSDDTECRNVGLGVVSTNDGVNVKFYKVTFFYIPLRSLVTKLPTEWDDLGFEGDKLLQQLELEIDTQNVQATIQLQVDGATVQTLQATANGRQIVPLSLTTDTIGRLTRLIISSTTPFRYYSHRFQFLKDSILTTNMYTEWTDIGYEGDKRLRQLELEINTQNTDATVLVQVDNVTVQTLTVAAGSRQMVPFSLAADIIGKLTRLVISSPTAFRYYSHKFEFLSDPLQMTRYDTIELDFGYTRWKYIRRLWIAAQTPNTISIQIYVDQVLRYTSPSILIQSSSGWTKYELRLPPGLKGMVFRFVITSSALYKIFMNQSDVEWASLAGDRGYDRAPLANQEFLPATRKH